MSHPDGLGANQSKEHLRKLDSSIERDPLLASFISSDIEDRGSIRLGEVNFFL